MPVAKRKRAVTAVSPLTEAAAADLMWAYYKDRKAQFVDHIREYRGEILSLLMAGVPAESVFAPYVKPPQPARAVRLAA